MTTTTNSTCAASDTQLLAMFNADGSETAFRTLVERHAGMVYGVCRRGLADDTELVQEATQAVFIVLARKARGLRKGRKLASWLLKAANLVVRTVRRRQAS